MWRLREQQGIFGQAKQTTPTSTSPSIGLTPANSSLQRGMQLVGNENPPLFRNDHDQNPPNNNPLAVSQQLPIPTRTAGVKRQTAISTATAENYHFFSQTSNKRHCNETTRQGDPETGAANPKKRSGGVLVVAANQHPNQQQQQHNQQQHQAHYFSSFSRADGVGSKKAKTEHCSGMDDDANMVICEDEPEPKHRDEARDVWDYIGVG